jgi:hypothetical protein
MRFSKSFWNVPSALLATAALVLIAGTAAGQDEFFDYDMTTDILDDGYEGSWGRVDGSGDSTYDEVYFWCEDANNSFEIGCYTDHADKVNLSKTTGKVDQGKKGNYANVWMAASALGGNEVDIDEDLTCDKVTIKGKGESKKWTADVKCQIKNCKLPADLTVGEKDAIIECAEAALDNEDLGKKVGKMRLNSDDEITGKIRSKGVWD